MQTIRSSADMARLLAGALDPPLRQMLIERRDQLLEHEGYDLGELTRIVVVRPGDTLAEVEAEAGLALMSASFEFVVRHGRWLEAVVVLSDDGFGVLLFVPDRIDVDPALLLPLLARL